MPSPSNLSTYLVRQPIIQGRTPQPIAWSWRRRLRLWRRSALKVTPRYLMGVGLWLLLLAGIVTTYQPTNTKALGSTQKLTLSVITPTTTPLASAGITELPSGPTGGDLPPNYIAPAYSYANSYTRGQCTWYVAGRRQVPSNWGNAARWLSRARDAGWSTGTIPAVGAIAWTGAGWYGHVALVIAVNTSSVEVSEMNYDGAYIIDQRWAPEDSFEYIY